MDSKTNRERVDGLDLGLVLLALGAGSMDALGFFALGGARDRGRVDGTTVLRGLIYGRPSGDSAQMARVTRSATSNPLPVIEAMGAGDLAPDEAAIVCGVLEAKRKAIEMVEFEQRLAALEQKEEQR